MQIHNDGKAPLIVSTNYSGVYVVQPGERLNLPRGTNAAVEAGEEVPAEYDADIEETPRRRHHAHDY